MKKNIGTAGRILRLCIGSTLLVYAYLKMSVPVLFVAIFVLFEALFGWCALYAVLGINRCPKK